MNSFLRMILANFATVAGCTMFIVLPAYLEKSGLGRWQIGLADGCFWSISVFIQPWLGPRLDRHGAKPFLLLGTFIMAVVASLFYFFPVNPLAVMVLRALQGAGFAIYLTSSWTWVAGHVDPQRRGEFFGYFGISSLLAGIVGPAVGEHVGGNYQQAFLAAAVIFMVAICLHATLSSTKGDVPDHEHESLSFLGLLALPQLRSTAVGALGFGLAVGSLFAFAAAYITQLKIHGIALTFGFITLASGVARWWMGRKADSHGPAYIILPSLLLLSGGCLGLSSLVLCGPLAPAMLCLAGLAAGLGYGAIYPALNGLAVDRLPEQAKGRGLSLVTASIDLGNTAGAGLAGLLATHLGYSNMFLIIGVSVLLTSGVFRLVESRFVVNDVAKVLPQDLPCEA